MFKENKRLPPKPYMSGATVPFPAPLCFLMARTAPPMAPPAGLQSTRAGDSGSEAGPPSSPLGSKRPVNLPAV